MNSAWVGALLSSLLRCGRPRHILVGAPFASISTTPIPSWFACCSLDKAKKEPQQAAAAEMGKEKTTTMTSPTNSSASVQLGLLID